MNKLVYIGAGLDIIPLIVLNHIKEYIYIDSRPQSEYGMLYYDDKTMYRKTFISELKNILKNNNYKLKIETKNYLEYTNNDKTLKYHISTAFPEMITDELKNTFNKSENLMIAGFDPNKKIITEFMPNLKNIYTNMHTCFDSYVDDYFEDDEQKKNSSVHYLNENNGNYNYYAMKEKKDFEYWVNENILPELKDNFDIIKIKNLIDIYNFK
jgi:hypothetical protein